MFAAHQQTRHLLRFDWALQGADAIALDTDVTRILARKRGLQTPRRGTVRPSLRWRYVLVVVSRARFLWRVG